MTYIAAAIGAAYGALLAKRRKGGALDIAQYAAGFGIFGALIGLILNIVILRAS